MQRINHDEPREPAGAVDCVALPDTGLPESAAWYCVRTQLKQEHIAASQLRQAGISAFLPRLRFKRPTRLGPVWVTEALFPNYLFAQFALSESLRQVKHTWGVRDVVHFGDRWPTVADAVIAELRAAVGDEDVRVIPEQFAPGDAVQVAGGPFHGLEAIVTRVTTGKQRVAVLLEFLGRQTTVELTGDQLVFKVEQRGALFAARPEADLAESAAA